MTPITTKKLPALRNLKNVRIRQSHTICNKEDFREHYGHTHLSLYLYNYRHISFTPGCCASSAQTIALSTVSYFSVCRNETKRGRTLPQSVKAVEELNS